MTVTDFDKAKRLYGRLIGLKGHVFSTDTVFEDSGQSLNRIIYQLKEALEDSEIETFSIPNDAYFSVARGRLCRKERIQQRILELLGYLEYGYNLSEAVISIGSIYNSIKDEELKSRCSDILAAPGNFDRVINQATLVFEDRIRNKANADRSFIGVPLVNKVLNPDLTKTILKVSDDENEHRGFCDICRGVMAAYRNPTHHYVTDYTRENALKICAFIDNLLTIIDKAKIVNK